MALDAGTNWEVRSTGVDTNGGAFVPGGAGTDFSQQDAPNSSGTLGTATGTTAFSDVGHAFTSSEANNFIQIASGAGFTPGFYWVVSVASGIATLDRSPGTGTVAVWALGGGLLTLGAVISSSGPVAPGHVVWVKSGTYTMTAAVIFPTNSSANPICVIGYQTVHGDNTGTRPLLTTSTNAAGIFNWTSSGALYVIQNINMTSTAGTPGQALTANQQVTGLLVRWCKFTGWKYGIYGDFAVVFEFINMRVVSCEFTTCTTAGIAESVGAYIEDCYFHDNTGDGYQATTTRGGVVVFTRCRFYNNSHGVIDATGAGHEFVLDGNDFSDNSSLGLSLASAGAWAITWMNNIVYNNGITISVGTTQNNIVNQNNAYGGTGTVTGLSPGLNDVTLSGDPFNGRTSNDFTLNNTAGAGAACRGAGYPLYEDIGALQHQDSGGGGGGGIMVSSGMTGGMRT